MESPTRASRITVLTSTAVVVAALYFAQGVLIPVALAILLSFLLAPLVSRLERWGLGRVPAVVGVVLLVFLAIGFVGWVVAAQIADLAQRLPEYAGNLDDKLSAIRDRASGLLEGLSRTFRHIGAGLASVDPAAPAESVAPVRVATDSPLLFSPLDPARATLGPLFSIIGVAGVVVIIVVFMLLQREDLRDRLIRLAGRGEIPLTTQALDEASRKVSRYLWTQTLINGIHGLSVATGLALIGFPNFLVWGLLSMLLRYIPYVGPWIAATFPVLLSFAMSSGWTTPLLTIGLFIALELISNNWIEPWLYGTRTGISPVAVLVSAVFWTWLWGGVGLVLAMPLTVCLAVMGKYVPQLHFLAILLGDEPVLPPQTRLYQRLLAADPQESWKVIAKALNEHDLVEVYDTVVLPALALAEHDQRRGRIDGRTQELLLETFEELIAEVGEKALEARPAGDRVAGARAARVLCLPAHHQADYLAALMLAQVVGGHDVESEAVSVEALASEMLDLVDERRADLVCISAVPPTALAHARYLYKRLSTRFPDLPVVVGVWGKALDRLDTAQRIGCRSNATVAATLAEARAQVVEALAPLRGRRELDASEAGPAAETG